MGLDRVGCEREDGLQFVQNMVSRFPIGCACYQTVLSDTGRVSDYRIVEVNAQFETLSGLTREQLVDQKMTEAFRRIQPEAVGHILVLGDQARQNREEMPEFHISVLNHAYKVSFLHLTNRLMLGLYQEIQPQAYRKLHPHAIPYDVVIRNLSGRMSNFFERFHHWKHQGLCAPEDEETNPETDMEASLVVLQSNRTFPDVDDLMFRDALTGLYDRVFALNALQMYITRGAVPISVVLGDVNGLNTTNQARGYKAGNELLIRIAQTLRNQCREEDIVARWGDDEFLILLPYTSEGETQSLLKRLQGAIHAQCGIADGDLMIFGYATTEYKCCTAEALIREAEKWSRCKKRWTDGSDRSGILRPLLSALYEKSTETQEHSERMTEHCQKIAIHLGFSSEKQNDLILLSMLHDIGKIGIRHEILNKPGPLTPEERLEIETHSEVGCRIAQNIPALSQVSGYILAHHERWDGTGYPNGMKGKEIPLPSRIVAVADAFDVMITGRPYRPARSKREASRELQRCSGTQFDPQIVDIMIELVQKQYNMASLYKKVVKEPRSAVCAKETRLIKKR